MGRVEADGRAIERELTTALGAWAVGSVIGGAAIALVGRATNRPGITAFGRQQVGWGAVDGAIAAFGAWRGRGRGPAGFSYVAPEDRPSSDDVTDARRLLRLLRINTGLDVVYVAGGLALVTAAPRVAERAGRPASSIRGDGWGIVVQGGYLLALDAFFATRMARFLATVDTQSGGDAPEPAPEPTVSGVAEAAAASDGS